MDPINNPTPNLTPSPNLSSDPIPNPAAAAAPSLNLNPTPTPAPTMPSMPTPAPAPAPEPTVPNMPEMAVPDLASVAADLTNAARNNSLESTEMPLPAAGTLNPTLNPTFNPTFGSTPVSTPTAPVAEATSTPTPANASFNVPGPANAGSVVNPMSNTTVNNFQANGIADTTPLTMPQAPQAPDPVQQELEAPLRPADPVPGSIGSAISGPATNTPSVAFNDPALVSSAAATMASTNLPEKKKSKFSFSFGKKDPNAPKGKMSRTTLILLIAVAAMVIVALVGVLISQLL